MTTRKSAPVVVMERAVDITLKIHMLKAETHGMHFPVPLASGVIGNRRDSAYCGTGRTDRHCSGILVSGGGALGSTPFISMMIDGIRASGYCSNG